MTITNFFKLTIMLSLLASCVHSHRPNLSDILSSKCFWDITGEKNVVGGLNSCFRFSTNGECKFYYYYFNNKRKSNLAFHYDDDDVVISNTWIVLGDTLLKARNLNYKVLKFVSNSVSVVTQTGDSLIFKKNCQTIEGHKPWDHQISN